MPSSPSTTLRPGRPSPLGIAAGIGATALGVLALAAVAGAGAGIAVGAVLVAVAAGICVWHVDPAYTFSAALVLSSFEGNWPALGIPGFLSLDRLLLVAGVIAVALRAPGCRDRPRLRSRPLYWLMAAALAYVMVSAAHAQTLTDKHAFLAIVDSVGVVPFLVFAVAPAVFRTAKQRSILVAALVILGAYYGFTALFETIGPKSLVWPRYIVDPNYGIHAGRARGPFAEAVTFGIGLFVCAVGCAIAMMTWETRRWRAAAAAVGLLCLLGMLFTVTRSVWIGGVVGILAFMLAIRELRRWVIPGLLAATALILVALIAVPGLQAKVQSRADQQATVWDRQNLDRAAIDMAEHKPLVGFGWDTFIAKSPDYFQQSANYPLPVGPEIVHNVWLSFLAELGLVGTALLVGTMLIGIGGVLLLRGPPSARVWQAFLLGYVVCYLVVSNFVTPETFPHLVLWLLGGVALGAVRQPRAEEGASASTRIELAPSYA